MTYSDTIKRTWNDNRLMSVMLELTYACNLDCVFCYNDLSLGGRRLSLAQYRELLEDLAALGVLNLALTGGEPLAHPRFFEIASHARSLGFVIRLKTNGHAVREPVARRIREEIDPFLVEVSIHGASAATHDRQTRVAGSFERLVANIRTMKSLGLRVKANSVLTRWNEHEIESLLALFDELGVAFQIDPEVKPKDDGDRSPLAIESSAEGQERYRTALDARAKRDDVVSDTPSPAAARRALVAGTDKHCGAGSNSIAVDPYGRVLPCVQWRVPVGDLHEQRIADIWAGSIELEGIRETTKAVRRNLEGIGEAGLVSNFCPGAAHTYSGDALAVYPPAERRMAATGRARVRLTVV
ncbi:MAG: radical SAM/SPASM domain-containing protein [Polyangiales bacterium]